MLRNLIALAIDKIIMIVTLRVTICTLINLAIGIMGQPITDSKSSVTDYN